MHNLIRAAHNDANTKSRIKKVAIFNRSLAVAYDQFFVEGRPSKHGTIISLTPTKKTAITEKLSEFLGSGWLDEGNFHLRGRSCKACEATIILKSAEA